MGYFFPSGTTTPQYIFDKVNFHMFPLHESHSQKSFRLSVNTFRSFVAWRWVFMGSGGDDGLRSPNPNSSHCLSLCVFSARQLCAVPEEGNGHSQLQIIRLQPTLSALREPAPWLLRAAVHFAMESAGREVSNHTVDAVLSWMPSVSLVQCSASAATRAELLQEQATTQRLSYQSECLLGCATHLQPKGHHYSFCFPVTPYTDNPKST